MEKEKSLSLFSADTLNSIAMAEIMGGIINIIQCRCTFSQTCNDNHARCSETEVTYSLQCDSKNLCGSANVSKACVPVHASCAHIVPGLPGAPGFELHPGAPILVLPPGKINP